MGVVGLREIDIVRMIEEDAWMMRVLEVVRGVGLPDWWVGAGFVRNKVWDVLHGYRERTTLNDVDVIYFDSGIVEEKREKEIERRLQVVLPGVPWSVKNQARMALVKGDGAY